MAIGPSTYYFQISESFLMTMTRHFSQSMFFSFLKGIKECNFLLNGRGAIHCPRLVYIILVIDHQYKIKDYLVRRLVLNTQVQCVV